MFVVGTTGRFDCWLANCVFEHEVTHEFARLNVVQNRFHAGLCFNVWQDARARDVLTVFCCVGDGVIHVGDAAFIDQVNDQLCFVQAFEICHFRLVTGLNQCLETHTDQFNDTTTKNGLFTKEVSFAFLTEVSLDDARPSTTNAGTIGKASFHGFSSCVRVDSNKARHAAAFGEFAAHCVTGAFWGHHDHVNAFFRLNQAKVDVQAVGKCNRGARLDVVLDVFVVCFCLKLIGHGEHDQITPSCCFSDAHNGEAFAFGFRLGR